MENVKLSVANAGPPMTGYEAIGIGYLTLLVLTCLIVLKSQHVYGDVAGYDRKA